MEIELLHLAVVALVLYADVHVYVGADDDVHPSLNMVVQQINFYLVMMPKIYCPIHVSTHHLDLKHGPPLVNNVVSVGYLFYITRNCPQLGNTLCLSFKKKKLLYFVVFISKF